MYGKLPRLEADSGPGHSLPPSAGNQDPCSYKGAYFSCPMGLLLRQGLSGGFLDPILHPCTLPTWQDPHSEQTVF